MKRKAFTLVEFLVIVGIIAMLACILMGGFRSKTPPVQLAPNVYEFSVGGLSDTFGQDLTGFLSSHPNLRMKTTTPENFDGHGKPWKYLVTFEEKN